MKNISEWLKSNSACSDGYQWAVKNCSTMMDVWDTAKPDWLIWVATRPDVIDEISLRRFACFCARQVLHLLTDDRSKNAVIVAENYCNGKTTKEELKEAAAAAAAEEEAARAAARAAAWAAAAAAGAARAAQCKWLRDNCTPKFD